MEKGRAWTQLEACSPYNAQNTLDRLDKGYNNAGQAYLEAETNCAGCILPRKCKNREVRSPNSVSRVALVASLAEDLYICILNIGFLYCREKNQF